LYPLQFGESQKLRLVRILRSTVMVRVGGGWVALDEFLLKNDPCRGEQGTLNIKRLGIPANKTKADIQLLLSWPISTILLCLANSRCCLIIQTADDELIGKKPGSQLSVRGWKETSNITLNLNLNKLLVY